MVGHGPARRVGARCPRDGARSLGALARGQERRRARGRSFTRLPSVCCHAAFRGRGRAQFEQPFRRQGLGRGHRGQPLPLARYRRYRHHQRSRHPGGSAGLGGETAVPGPATVVQRRNGGRGPALLCRSRVRAGRPPALRSGSQVARPAAGRAGRPRPGPRAGGRTALRADQGGLPGRRRRPVLSANQASLWHCLRSAAVHTQIAGYGHLLRL